MKNTIIFLAFGFLCAAVFIYPARLQEQSESRMLKAVWNAWESRRKIEDSIKTESESRRRTREFINQSEYQRGIEETVDVRFAQIADTMGTMKNDFEAGFQARSAESDAKLAALAQRIELEGKASRESAGRQEQRLGEYRAVMQQLAGRVAGLESSAARGGADMKDERARNKKAIDTLARQVEGLRQQISVIQRRLTEENTPQ